MSDNRRSSPEFPSHEATAPMPLRSLVYEGDKNSHVHATSCLGKKYTFCGVHAPEGDPKLRPPAWSVFRL